MERYGKGRRGTRKGERKVQRKMLCGGKRREGRANEREAEGRERGIEDGRRGGRFAVGKGKGGDTRNERIESNENNSFPFCPATKKTKFKN